MFPLTEVVFCICACISLHSYFFLFNSMLFLDFQVYLLLPFLIFFLILAFHFCLIFVVSCNLLIDHVAVQRQLSGASHNHAFSTTSCFQL